MTDETPAVDTVRIHRSAGHPTRIEITTASGATMELEAAESSEARLAGWFVIDEPICGHCGKVITQASRGISADGTVLCHTGTLPPEAEPADCYRLVTVHQHAADGSCCREMRADG